MDKTARKRSADPVQEKLRTDKDIWNKEVSQLISRMIGFKRGINGREDPTVGIPASHITEPFPPQVSSVLSDLASHYNQVLEGAGHIISEQESYSQSRHHHAEESLEQLTKYSSWWGSRIYAHYSLRALVKEERTERLRAIKTAADLVRDFKEFEDDLIANQIPRAFTKLTSNLNSFAGLVLPAVDKLQALDNAKNIKEESTEPNIITDKNIPAPDIKEPEANPYPDNEELVSTYEAIRASKEKFQVLLNILKDANISQQGKNLINANLDSFIKSFNKVGEKLKSSSTSPGEINKILREFIDSYAILAKVIQDNEAIIIADINPEFDINKYLVKIANPINRWISEKILSWRRDELSMIKTDNVNFSKATRASLHDLMDTLENSASSTKEIVRITKGLNLTLTSLVEKMLYLGKKYNFEERRKHTSRLPYQESITQLDIRQLLEVARKLELHEI